MDGEKQYFPADFTTSLLPEVLISACLAGWPGTKSVDFIVWL